MKKTTHYHEDKSKGQYSTVDDAPMLELFNKLEKLAGSYHLKIYWREYKNYEDGCIMQYIHGTFLELKHEITLANACGSERRIWLEHNFQRNSGEMVSPISIVSPVQIESFDRAFTEWLFVGQDVTDSDLTVAKDILKLKEENNE